MSSTNSSDLLNTYLNDHLGGASAGVEMARRLQAEVQGERDAEVLGRLAEEINEDRETLRDLIDRLGAGRNRAKQAAGWVAEKIERLGVARLVTGSAHLTRLLMVESLSLGVEGKLCLWHTLAELQGSRPELAGLDLDRLAGRARDQRRRLETVRLDVARRTWAIGG